MSEADVTPSRLWRDLLSDDVVAYETDRFVHSHHLFAEERAIVRDAVPSRVEEFATGRVCARLALADLGYPSAPLLRDRDRRPTWPAGCHGSITHTEGYCAAAVAPAALSAGIGIDVEVAGRVGERLEPRICTPAEIGRLERLDEVRRGAAATTIFSAKEAVFKCQSHLPDALRAFHDVEIELEEEAFRVLFLRDPPEALGDLAFLEGRRRIEGALIYCGVMLPPSRV